MILFERFFQKYIIGKVRAKRSEFQRVVSVGDCLIDRWEKARIAGFGKNTSVYDSCLILGDVIVGDNCWIGPYTILDGSGGGLVIGDNCNISAGVHIYTHDTVDRVLSDGPVTTAPVSIGNNCYIGPHSVITKGITLGSYVVIGANSLVNKDIPSFSKAFGTPARVVENT